MTDSMTRGRNHRSLFLAAINTYLRYTLCDAQQLHRKAQENHHLHNTDATSDVYRCHSDLIQCIQKILRWQSTSAEMVHVIYGLAMLDRQQQCVLWSDLSVRCGYLLSSCRGSWCTGWRLVNDSVTYLDYAMIAEMRNDPSLAADWMTASCLCVAAAQQCSLLKHPGKFLTASDKSEERSRVCETIGNLLIQFPDIVPGETEPIIAIYKAKFGMAELLPGLDTFIPRCFPPDSGLAPLYGKVYQLLAAARDDVRGAYDGVNEAVSNQRIFISKVTGLTNLTSACLDALAAVDTCSGYTDVPIESNDTYENLQQCVAEAVDELTTAYLAGPLEQPSVVTVTDIAANRLFARLNDIIARAHSLKSAALVAQAKARSTVPALIRLYDSKADAARAERPQRPNHLHIAECYERAANLVRSATDSDTNLLLARKFAALAEGAFTSTMVCFQYHQRALDSGDQQLAAVLASILDRSHAIGQSDLQALNAGVHVNDSERDGKDVVGAVHLAGQAVEILSGRNTTHLQHLQAKLKLCIADSSLTTDASLRRTVQTVAQSLHALIQPIQHPSALKLPGLSVVQDTPLVRDILQTLVRQTCALARSLVTDFASVAQMNKELLSKVWHSALKALTRNVAALKRHQLTDTDHALTAHAVDLLLLALQEVVHGRICSGGVLKLTARKFQDARNIDNSGDQYVLRLTPEKRARLRSFRIYLALRFEQEVLLPFAAAHSPTMAVPVAEFCLQSPDEIADLPYARIVSEVVKVSNSVVSCLRRANSKSFAGTVAARELQDAAGHYLRAADNLALQAEHQIVGAVDSAANSARVSAVIAATRLSLLAAKASEGAHAAAQAERYEIRNTYGRVLILLPDLKEGAELFYGVNVQQAKDAVVVLETLGTYYIHVAQALLNGEYIRAEYWRRAAQICARAVNGGPKIRLDARLRENWKETVQSAEAVAKLAGGIR